MTRCILRDVAIAAIAVFALGSANVAAADAVASDWVEGQSNKARLVAGRDASNGLYAGVEISMPDGWKTYWRSPGDAGGVPPEFDWSGSDNLKAAEVLYPAPHRLHDKAGDVVGYKDHVVFPVKLTPTDAAKPVTLHGKITYGVCKDICIPAEMELQLRIPPDASTSDALKDALTRVPRKSDAEPKLAKWRIDSASGKPQLVLSVETLSPADVDAFVEAPGGIYVPLPKRQGEANGAINFAIDLTDGIDIKDLRGKLLTVTIIDGKGQSEATIPFE